MKLVDRVTEWVVPRTAVELAIDPPAVRRAIHWLEHLDVRIPPPAPFALDPNDGYRTVPIPDDDDARDELLIITPEYPDLRDLAENIVYMALDETNRGPGPWSWRYSPLVGRLAGFLYVSGITRSGGSIEWGHGLGTIYTLPSWRDVLPRRGARLRPYLLWRRDWWWECHIRQGMRLGRHRPLEPYAMGICAACLPCWSCGAFYACTPGCEALQ